MVGLSEAGVSSPAWLLRRPKAWRMSVELARDDALRSSTMISRLMNDSLAPSSSSGVPPSVSDKGTVTIESVGRGELSTCVLGERSVVPSMFGATFSSFSIVVFPSDVVSHAASMCCPAAGRYDCTL
jgi:hypothetical protein